MDVARIPVTEVERMIFASRDRQRFCEAVGDVNGHAVASHQLNRWLDLWRPAKQDGAVLV